MAAAAVAARDLLAYPAKAYLRRKHAMWSFVGLMKEMANLGKGDVLSHVVGQMSLPRM